MREEIVMKPKVKSRSEVHNNVSSRVALSSINNKDKPRGIHQKQEQNISQLWNGSAEILKDLGVAVLDDRSNDFAPVHPPPRKKSCTISSPSSSSKGPSATPFRCVAEDLVLFRRSRSEGPLGQDQFSKLSDEILLHIFKWLPKPVLSRCARVCKRWKTLAYDESLWRKLDLGKCDLKPGIVGLLVSRGVVALRLALSEVAEPIFLKNSPRICKVQYLDLSMANIPVDALAELLGICHNLKNLSLEHCTVNDDICRSIGHNKHLQVLNMCMCYGITSEGVRAILIGCQNLVAVNVAWCHLTEAAISCLVEHIPPSVTRLNISGCRQTLVDAHIRHLVQRCSRLVELDISDGSALTGTAFEIIVSCLKNIQHLHASHTYGCSFVHLLLLTHSESLRRLEVFGLLSETNLQFLRQNLPQVEINKQPFSTVARPTTGNRRTRIWGIKLSD